MEIKKKVSLMDFEGNPNIGIYMFVNDKFCLVGPEISESKEKEIAETFGVKVYRATVLGTDLVGVFVAGNNDFIIAPSMYDYELKNFEKICKEHDVKLFIMEDIQNTFGNNVCVADEEILINPDYSKKFEKALAKRVGKGMKIVKIGHNMFNSVGSTCVYANDKFFIAQEYSEDDVNPIASKVGALGTVNAGSNFVASGAVANKNGIILGSMCSTVEIQNIIESLDYL